MKLPRLVWRERPRRQEGSAHVFDRAHDARLSICRQVRLQSAKDWRIVARPITQCRGCARVLEDVRVYGECRP